MAEAQQAQAPLSGDEKDMAARSQPSGALKGAATSSEPSAAHPPGPWNAWHALDDTWTVKSVRMEGGCRVTRFLAVCDSTGADNGANARLMASAPDLREALVDLMVYHDVPGPVDAVLVPLLRAGFAALAKADGNAALAMQTGGDPSPQRAVDAPGTHQKGAST